MHGRSARLEAATTNPGVCGRRRPTPKTHRVSTRRPRQRPGLASRDCFPRSERPGLAIIIERCDGATGRHSRRRQSSARAALRAVSTRRTTTPRASHRSGGPRPRIELGRGAWHIALNRTKQLLFELERLDDLVDDCGGSGDIDLATSRAQRVLPIVVVAHTRPGARRALAARREDPTNFLAASIAAYRHRCGKYRLSATTAC